MTDMSPRSAVRDTSTPNASAILAATPQRSASDEATGDQPLAGQLIEQIMRHHIAGKVAARPALLTRDDAAVDDPAEMFRVLDATARCWHIRCDREVRARFPGMTATLCSVLMQLSHNQRVNQATLAQLLNIRP